MTEYTYACLGRTCWLAQFDDRACEGRMDPAHLIPKQTLKKARCEVDLWDERLWVPACRFHHGQWDNHRFVVPRESLPVDFVGLVGELGLDWYLDRRFPATAEAVA